jgi:hypothetical protein
MRRAWRVPAVVLALAGPAGAWEVDLGGDARSYQFLRLEEDGPARRDAELGVVRLKLRGRHGAEWGADAHGVIALTSPPAADASAIATGSTRSLLDL